MHSTATLAHPPSIDALLGGRKVLRSQPGTALEWVRLIRDGISAAAVDAIRALLVENASLRRDRERLEGELHVVGAGREAQGGHEPLDRARRDHRELLVQRGPQLGDHRVGEIQTEGHALARGRDQGSPPHQGPHLLALQCHHRP